VRKKAEIPPQPSPADSRCPYCHGLGFVSRDVIRKTLDGPLPVPISTPCRCRRVPTSVGGVA
jgi:hypothetical protein